MKYMKQMAAICALLIAGSTQVVHAESSNIELMIPESWGVTGTTQVNVPFAFSVLGKTLEPGSYSISPNGEKQIVIKAASGKTAVVALTNAISVAPNATVPKLVFHRYGDQYFLAETWLSASDAGRVLLTSREEQSAQQDSRQLSTSDKAGR
jgi:hypothetical protein